MYYEMGQYSTVKCITCKLLYSNLIGNKLKIVQSVQLTQKTIKLGYFFLQVRITSNKRPAF